MYGARDSSLLYMMVAVYAATLLVTHLYEDETEEDEEDELSTTPPPIPRSIVIDRTQCMREPCSALQPEKAHVSSTVAVHQQTIKKGRPADHNTAKGPAKAKAAENLETSTPCKSSTHHSSGSRSRRLGTGQLYLEGGGDRDTTHTRELKRKSSRDDGVDCYGDGNDDDAVDDTIRGRKRSRIQKVLSAMEEHVKD
jgi:hypothetical protein